MQETTDKIDQYIFYMIIIVTAIFIVTILILVAGFVFNILSLMSMQSVDVVLGFV